MCGIFAYKGKASTAAQIILSGLKSLEYRGYDSWGVAVRREDGSLSITKEVGKIGEATIPASPSSMGLGHTRWATHGGVTRANAHPHTDCNQTVVLIHNGIIENFASLKRDLPGRHQFASDTDTEVADHLIENELKNGRSSKEAVMKVFAKLEGLNAFIVFFPASEEFVAIKNGSPLVIAQDKGTIVMASDSTALLPHSKRVYYLEDGELFHVGRDGAHLYDSKNKKKIMKFTPLPYKKEDLSLGRFPHYMIKEINEQPRVLVNLLQEEKQIKELAAAISSAFGTYLIGCGTAYYAAEAGTYLFSKIAGLHINASIGSEFGYMEGFLRKKSLVVALSQSGETIDIIASAKALKGRGATLYAITNTLGSSLYRMSDKKILLGAGPEQSVCSTKAFTAKIAVLFLAAHQMAGTLERGRAQLRDAILEVEAIIKNGHDIRKLAKMVAKHEHVFVLGRGTSYPLALESALKIKEVSYIHAEGFAGGELKHGVMALIDKGTPVIVYNPEDETYQDTLSSAYEVKARGAYVIGVSSRRNSVYDEFIKVKNCGEATLIPNVVIAQLLGYYLALEKKYDPDKPRNLAKSVTVK